MSQVARVFVVLNLLVAAGFLFAGATFLGVKADYKSKYEAEVKAHKESVETRDAEIKSLQDQRNEMERLRDAARGMKSQLEVDNTGLKQQLAGAETEKATKNEQIAALTATNNGLQQSVARQTALTDRLTTEADQAKQAAATARASEQKALKDLEAERNTVRDRDNKIAEQERAIVARGHKIEELELMVQKARELGINFETLILMKPVMAQVTGSHAETKLVMINKGKDAGVERGYVFDIVRGDAFIGRFTIDQVYPTSSSGTLTLVKAGQDVRVGDLVTNHLN